MCGRFVGHFSLEDLLSELDGALADHEVAKVEGSMPLFENFNVAPTQVIPVLRANDEGVGLTVEPMRWGLVPSWSKDPRSGSPLINARAETVTEKPSFRNLVGGHRCVIPMTGFYEWDRTDPKNKVPYFVPRADGHLMLALGLWNRPTIMEGTATVTMLTCASTGELARIHDRSPVHSDASHALDWILEASPPMMLCNPDSLPPVRPRRVSRRVNSIRNNGPKLLESDSEETFRPSSSQDLGKEPPMLF